MSDDPPNVIFFVLDTARARDIAPYLDSDPKTMPFFREFASQNINFEQCISTAPWTLPAHASMFTGLAPSQHGVNSWEDSLSKETETLATRLRSSDYQTVGITNNSWVSDLFGLSKGFDDFYKLWQFIQHDNDLIRTSRSIKQLSRTETVKRLIQDVLGSGNLIVNLANGLYGKVLHNRNDYGAKRTNRIIKKWIRREWDDDQPFFLFANYLEPHLEYQPPAEHAEPFLDVDYLDAREIPQDPIRYMLGDLNLSDDQLKTLRGLYQGELHYLDSCLHDIYSFLDTEGVLDNTVVVLVGDHGDNIGDHGLMSHFYSLHDSLVRVPCAVQLPSAKTSTVGSQIQVTDLFPLILREAGVLRGEDTADKFAEVPPPFGDGRELAVSELLGVNPPEQAVDRRTDGSYNEELFEEYKQPLRSVRADGRKLVKRGDNTFITYEIDSCDETAGAIDDGDLMSFVTEWEEEHSKRGSSEDSDIDQQTEKRLQELGYL
jgi:arylsulfatase A-like enzyme